MSSPPRSRRATAGRVAVGVLVVACLALLTRTFVDGYSDIRTSLETARWGLMAVAMVAAVGGMVALALLWQACLRAQGHDRRAGEVTVWYFAGELGKYLPGGVWTVVGRGEIAARHGVGRGVAYVSVTISLLVTIVAGVCLVAIAAPLGFEEGGSVVWLGVPTAVAALASLHPSVLGVLARVVAKLSGGRLQIDPLPITTMLGLVIRALPVWVLVGIHAWLVTEGLGLEGELLEVGAAAVAAWVAGLVAVPVPAGVGVRELVFVGASGLSSGPAVLAATAARLSFVLVDGLGGVIALRRLRRPGSRVSRGVG